MEDSKTEPASDNEYGLFVTSNTSLSHITQPGTNKTFCGLVYEMTNTRHPCSEIRWYMNKKKMKKWVSENRNFIDPGYRLCKRCLKSYDNS